MAAYLTKGRGGEREGMAQSLHGGGCVTMPPEGVPRLDGREVDKLWVRVEP